MADVEKTDVLAYKLPDPGLIGRSIPPAADGKPYTKQ